MKNNQRVTTDNTQAANLVEGEKVGLAQINLIKNNHLDHPVDSTEKDAGDVNPAKDQVNDEDNDSTSLNAGEEEAPTSALAVEEINLNAHILSRSTYLGFDSISISLPEDKEGLMDDDLLSGNKFIQEISNQMPNLEDTAFNIDENLPAGTLVGQVIATDPNSPATPFGTLSYSIINGDPGTPFHPGGLFSIDSNGQITTTAVLNYEFLSQYTLTIEVTDGGGLTDTATVIINVNDINEAPEVSPLNVFATEDDRASINLLAGASDPEGGPLSVENLSLVSGNGGGLFYFDNHLNYFGIGVLGKPDARYYDYLKEGEQEIVQYSYDIVDQTGLVTPQMLTLTITGINDKPYVFVAIGYALLEDSEPLTIDLLLGVNDSESDPLTVENFQVLTEVIDGTITLNGNELVIDPSYYTYLSAGEIVDITYSFDVSDGNGGVLSLIRGGSIFGLNDEPVISTMEATAEENQTAVLPEVVATDPNGDTITFSLNLTLGDDSDAFLIDPDSGALSFKEGAIPNFEQPADVNGDGVYEVTVRATDSYGDFTEKTIAVTVNDVNENPSIADATLNVDENQAANTIVGQVTASDPDSGATSFGTLTYAITGGNTGGAFSIDSNGQITTTQLLNHEANAQYTLTVEVADGGGLTDTSTVTVTVIDVNEAPTVSNSTFPLAENRPPNTIVGQVNASDPDDSSVSYGQLSYSITGGDPNNLFSINSNGVIKTNTSFHNAANYSLTVKVEDGGGLSDTATITVNVIDAGGGGHPPGDIDPPGGGGGGVVLAPIIIDINDNGFYFSDLQHGVLFDADSDGVMEKITWLADTQDGILVYDKDGDNQITQGGEISFTQYVEGAQTDLEGLRAFDSNHDNLLNQFDADYSLFKVWIDANGDGISDNGELAGLDQSGIESIKLSGDNQVGTNGDAIIYGYGEVQYSDGSQGQFADVGLTYTEIENDHSTDNHTSDTSIMMIGVDESEIILSNDGELFTQVGQEMQSNELSANIENNLIQFDGQEETILSIDGNLSLSSLDSSADNSHTTDSDVNSVSSTETSYDASLSVMDSSGAGVIDSTTGYQLTNNVQAEVQLDNIVS